VGSWIDYCTNGKLNSIFTIYLGFCKNYDDELAIRNTTK